ncbi:MAG: DNA gyrase C-terminal beta-propeller domain-containing protein, partial [Bacilli bacterium]
DFGVKIVITLKKDANANVVLNNLYKHTQLQNTFGIILLMLDQGVPKLLGLKDIISKYVDHQREVVIRRTKFDLDKALAKAHILEGYKIALDHLDDFIKIIRESESDVIAKDRLKSSYGISDAQADAILELRLRRLTGLEREKIERDLEETLKLIEDLRGILVSDDRVNDIIKSEMKEIADKYGDDRRTSIDMTAIDYIEDESLIPNDSVIVSMTKNGYIKRLVSDTYRSQHRGGVGIKGMATNDEDQVDMLISCSTHDYLLFFSNYGKVYRIKCYELPEFSRQSKGVPIVNILPLEKDEYVNAIIPVEKDDVCKNLMFFTRNGLVKRTEISEFDSIRKNGKIAITLKDGDELTSVKKTTGDDEVIMASNSGRMVRFNENEVRVMGRSASGVKGIDMDAGCVIGAEIVNNSELILVVTEKGYGKKTAVDEYRLTHRGSKGVKALNITNKNGLIVAFKSVVGDEDIIITTDEGTVIRLDVSNVSTLRRNTQGVRLMNLKDKQVVTSVTVVAKDENVDSEEGE